MDINIIVIIVLNFITIGLGLNCIFCGTKYYVHSITIYFIVFYLIIYYIFMFYL